MEDRKMINKEKYKKLTNDNLEECGSEFVLRLDCKYCGVYDRFIEIYNRLEELEDKIMDGTLVEIGNYELQENKK